MTTVKKLSLRIALECLVVGLLLAGTAAAQTITGSISGIVRDSSGAVVPGVKVVVTDKATNVSVTTDTNGAGVYVAPFLQSDTYRVTFSKEGFKSDVEENVPLVMNQQARVDVTLVLGSRTESVTVTATAPQLERESPVIGATVSNSDLIKLPQTIGSSGPTEDLLSKIFAGASSTSQNYTNHNDVSAAGGRPDTVPTIIDGLPVNQAADDTGGFQPTPDTTEELQMQITAYSAQYGETGGGVILTTTKAGTNNLHGALFEYHNDQGLNAVDFFNARPYTVPENIFNYFGGSAGGPVYIPGLWNGRKRHTFFFAGLEDTINYSPKTLNTEVPTAMELQGNFSGPTPTNTTTPTIYDPSTTTQGTTTSGTKVPVRTAFAGNIITTPEDPIAKKVFSFFPAPNCQLSTGANYCVSPVGYHSYLYNTDRVDQEIGDADRLWFRYGRDGPWGEAVTYFPNAANPSSTSGWRDYQEEATWVHIFSPTITNELRLGQSEESNFGIVASQDVSSLGLPGVPLTEFPSIGTSSVLQGLGGQSPSHTLDRHQVFNDELQIVRGRHSLHLGGEFMRYMDNVYSPGVLSGAYTFNGTFTNSTVLSTGKTTGGFAPADLYLGQVSSASISTTDYTYRYRLNYASAYVQDNFKVTSKLTINLGLRWEFDGRPTEVNNWLYTLNPIITDPTTGKLGAIQYAGLNGAPRHFMPDDYKGFLPRVGFAYGLGHNTVLRGGAGFFELPSIGFVATGKSSEYTRSCTYSSTSYVPAFVFQNGIPSPCAFNQSNGLPNIPSSLTSPTQAVAEFQKTGAIPVSQEWSLGVQHQFPHGWLGEVDYVGNKGTHLPVTFNVNQIAPSATCCYGQTSPTPQSLRPFPQWLNVNYFSYSAISNYHGLLMRVQHSWSQGLSTLFSFTWAKTMDDVDAAARADAVAVQNVYNIAAQYGVAMISIPKRFSAAYVWDVPMGAGGKLAANVPVVNQIIGHWNIAGITQFQTGYPYGVSQTNVTGWFGASQYTTRTGISPYNGANSTVKQWFNPAAFTPTASDTLGNTPRDAFYGPGQNNFDVSLSRNFPIKERYTFQIRADFTNAFNHPQFDNLSTACTTIVSGACGGTFGAATGDTGSRNVQLDARITF
ncbi:MAG: TonB-dependent receptor [Terriglobia bacterium]|jgi:hypothetical protein